MPQTENKKNPFKENVETSYPLECGIILLDGDCADRADVGYIISIIENMITRNRTQQKKSEREVKYD